MNENINKKTENTENIENTQTLDKPNKETYKYDITESYMFYRNYISENPITEYMVKKKCVELGKELLPDIETNKEIKQIHTQACEILNNSRPSRRSIKFEFQDFGGDRVIPIYRMLSNDADEAQAKEEEFEKILKNFIEQQHERHIEELQNIDNKIFHILVQKKVIPKKTVTVDEIINELIKNEIKNIREE